VFLNIYKVQICLIKHIQLIVKTHSRLHVSALQNNHQAFCKKRSISNCQYIWDVPVIRYGSVLIKRSDDGSVEPKHVALNVF